MPLLREETYTIEDIYALPEGERAELIDGHIYYMAPPSRKHQDISMELSSVIKDYIRSHGENAKSMQPRLQFILTRKQIPMWSRI